MLRAFMTCLRYTSKFKQSSARCGDSSQSFLTLDGERRVRKAFSVFLLKLFAN
jgi:hypothetical protein